MIEIKNGIIENGLIIYEDNLDEFIKILPNIKQIDGYLDLSSLKLTELPDLSNIVINGCLSCAYNNLTSLKGCPKIVKGNVFMDKNVTLSKEILNIIDNLTRNKTYLNKEDCLPILRELQLNKILNG